MTASQFREYQQQALKDLNSDAFRKPLADFYDLQNKGHVTKISTNTLGSTASAERVGNQGILASILAKFSHSKKSDDNDIVFEITNGENDLHILAKDKKDFIKLQKSVTAPIVDAFCIPDANDNKEQYRISNLFDKLLIIDAKGDVTVADKGLTIVLPGVPKEISSKIGQDRFIVSLENFDLKNLDQKSIRGIILNEINDLAQKMNPVDEVENSDIAFWHEHENGSDAEQSYTSAARSRTSSLSR